MALGPRTNKPLPSEAAEYLEEPPTGVRIGIALSGGGIRSAAFNLGALQALQQQRVLDRADYLTAVSGGNYIASALTISGAYFDPECENGKPLWAHGSPEERYLRQHTDYLAPGVTGRIWLAVSVVYGFVLNYLPFLLSAFIAGRVIGWLLFAFGLQLTDLRLPGGLALPTSRVLAALVLVATGCLVTAVLLVAYRRFNDGRQHPKDYGKTHSERVAAVFVTFAGLIGIALVLPAMAALYGTVSKLVLSYVLRESPVLFDTVTGRIAVAITWLLGSLLLAAVALALSRRFRARRLMLVLSSLAGAGLLLVPLLSSVEYSTRHGVHSVSDVLGLVFALAVVGIMSIKVHNRRYSMHLFYRERLNSAFALMRTWRDPGKNRVQAVPISYDQPLYFSEVGSRLAKNPGTVRLPKLVVCCAVNLTTDEVPVGRFAESFTFEYDRCGGPMFGYQETARYERSYGVHVPGTQLTLPSIMAVSGAALSPLMGRFTYPPLRFLMALTNVRLGVWIKNPLHPGQQSEAADAEKPIGRLARMAVSIREGWREPGSLYVLREALGGTKSSHRFIYLTDGGHWENLGLVELLRRRCTHVLCFDASSGAGLDIGRAIALARSELGAEIELDPHPVMPASDGTSEQVAVWGKIRYPDVEQEAKLVYAKAVLTPDASWDLLAFKARDGRFPNHSTAKQMFTDEQFEAYRSLGFEAGRRAAELLNIPDALLRVPDPAPVDAGNGQPDTGVAAMRPAR